MWRPTVVRDVEHVAEVGRSILVRRRADGDEHDVARRRWRPPTSVVKRQPPGCLVALDEPVETRLVDRQHVLLQPVDLPRVDVRPDDLVAGFGETRADDETDVSRSDDADLHDRDSVRRPRRSSRARSPRA